MNHETHETHEIWRAASIPVEKTRFTCRVKDYSIKFPFIFVWFRVFRGFNCVV